ncbi:D-alanyl-D-alanine carboxypeptidase family protein [Virgibacillus necropolis]|uniref:Carboxypeptidase n=1 Tax=Virgibacillus necropolis TaxID=163877 RepID=A0A221MHS2_9BACI|nr:D-alanyl-D-alanine carboxypeptidase family protein [Virgibacillus necropolis]ASN07208.1 carboxypeptidase [Virgibacillus necropolis]
MKRKLLSIILLLSVLCLFTACTEPTTANHSGSKDTTIEPKNDSELPASTLKSGDSGEDVKELQAALVKIGYEISVTGNFDNETTEALKDFQAQQVKLPASGEYNQATMKWLKKALDGEFAVEPGKGSVPISNPEETVIVDDPSDTLVLVNKSHALPNDYIPDDLIAPNVRFPFTQDLPKRYMREEAAHALEDLFKASDKAGLDLFAQSGYRSYNTQESIFASYVAKDGEDAANKYSARPGESEHQTGLTMDVTSPEINFNLNTNFAKTEEGKWVKAHAHEYGFIIRYPKGKESITKYQYEPWHLRYVGKEVATVIHEKDITLEKYLGAL